MYNLTWAVVLLPLGGILTALLVESPRRVAQACIAATALSFALSVLVLGYRLGHINASPYQSQLTFWTFTAGQPLSGGTVGDFHLQVGVLVDGLSAAILPVVALVSLLVQVHSVGYMRGDRGYSRYFMVIALFTFAMLGLVASPNFFNLYLMWEGVGVCSFLLIGHWWKRPAAAAAATKAFLVTRIGDLGLLLGIVFLFAKFAARVSATASPGTVADPFNFYVLGHEFELAHLGLVPGVGGRTLVVLALLVLMGAIGKSAQLPLHTWLPDAMEGPTPISALIHAATMVAAGVYLIARAYPLFLVAPHVLTVVALVGAASALFGAVVALAHTDIKRIIAYSTISHLGLMFTALGVGAFSAGVFHLFTHAWFKALLFLAAGNVIHAYGTQDIREMGGVWTRMRVTAWTMLVGALSAAGVVLFAGFWSKDSIIAGVLRNTTPAGTHIDLPVKAILVVTVSAASLLGALYPMRLFFVAFLGEPARRRGFAPQRIREAPRSMRVPVVVLAVLSAVAGLIGIAGARFTFGNFVFSGARPQDEPFNIAAVLLGGGLSLLGIWLAYLIWMRRRPVLAALPERLGRLTALSREGFHVDAAYGWVVQRLVVRPAALLPRADVTLTDSVADGAAEGVTRSAGWARRLQMGRLQAYAMTTVVAVVVLAGGLTLAATGHLPGVGATR